MAELTKNQAAKLARVSVKTIERWISTGQLKAFKYGPRLVRIDSDSLLDLRQPINSAQSLSDENVTIAEEKNYTREIVATTGNCIDVKNYFDESFSRGDFFVAKYTDSGCETAWARCHSCNFYVTKNGKNYEAKYSVIGQLTEHLWKCKNR